MTYPIHCVARNNAYLRIDLASTMCKTSKKKLILTTTYTWVFAIDESGVSEGCIAIYHDPYQRKIDSFQKLSAMIT